MVRERGGDPGRGRSVTLSAAVELRLGSLDLRAELGVESGELLALLGPNGAGKSTLLRALVGLQPIDGGRIMLDGAVLDEPASGTFVEPEQRSVGVVFQQYLLFDQMTVLENVAYGLRARRTPRAEARRQAGEWLERVGLAPYAAARPPSLSGGQAQRVALARALATRPHLLLLDEPLAALDVATRSAMRRDLRSQMSSFEGVRVLVTHDPVDAYALADRVAIIEGGRIVQTGTLAEVAAHPRSRFVADLVGVNLISGVVAAGVLTTPSGAAVVVADAPNGPTLAVIRPQAILLALDPPSQASARNVWPGIVGDVDRLGDRVRVTIDGLVPLIAEITVAALNALGLRPGDAVHVSVKATDVDTYPG
jgi:molybdate transport system ATP-binding protein